MSRAQCGRPRPVACAKPRAKMGLFAALFGPKLPRDRVTRIPRRVRRSAADHIKGLQGALDEISSLPGIADVTASKRMPKGFFAAVEGLYRHYDAYAAHVRKQMGIHDAPVAGAGAGSVGCIGAPFGITGLEALALYRKSRTRSDYPELAQRMAELAQEQLEDIQSRHRGKDPERIPMTSSAMRDGRIAFAKRGESCPFLDVNNKRCRVWEARPLSCRGHTITGDIAQADPRHEEHLGTKVVNIRLPVRPQVVLSQLEKRMGLSINPFMYAGQLQVLQLTEGEALLEVGEVAQRMGQDGRVAPKANRNVKHAKKHQKSKRRR